MKISNAINEKTRIASKFNSHIPKVIERANILEMEKHKKYMESYTSKAKRITMKKQIQEKERKEFFVKSQKLFIDRKNKQDEIENQEKFGNWKLMEEKIREFERDDIRRKRMIELKCDLSRRYWRNLTELNKEIQSTNIRLINKKEEYKRMNIYENRRLSLIEESLKKIPLQCLDRSLSASDKRKQMYKFIEQLSKLNPDNKMQRENLMNSLKKINNKLGLDLVFHSP